MLDYKSRLPSEKDKKENELFKKLNQYTSSGDMDGFRTARKKMRADQRKDLKRQSFYIKDTVATASEETWKQMDSRA